MKVILVNGSPHPRGTTWAALSEVSRTLNEEGIETSDFWVGTKPLAGCLACHKCVERKVCVFQDRVNEFLEVAADQDGFIFGTPVHWGAPSASIVPFMHRAFYADVCGGMHRFHLKPAAAVVCARRAGTTAAIDQMNKYFALSQMPIISSRYWTMVHGAEAAEVVQDQEGLQTMRFLARNMAYFLKCKEAATKAGIQPPKEEPVILTNFVRREKAWAGAH